MTTPTSSETIWAVKPIEQSSEHLLELLDRKDLYTPMLQQISTESRKQEWLSVRVLLKELLQEEKEIAYTDAGKPYLADHSYHISISHTQGFVAVALNKQYPVGIDIEYISPRVRKIRTRFMSNEEEQNICVEEEETHLLLHWSAKESLFKALGESDVDFRQCLHILPFLPERNKLSSFSAYETRTELRHRFLVNYVADDSYVLTFTALER